MKVSELNGAELDYWVAQACGVVVTIHDEEDGKPYCAYDRANRFKYAPSSDPSLAYTLITKHGITVSPHMCNNGKIDRWSAYRTWPMPAFDGLTGDTPLIAAMRCVVALAYGYTVE